MTDPRWGLPVTLGNKTVSVEAEKEAQIQEKKQLSLLQIALIITTIAIGVTAGLVFFFVYIKRLKHVAECSQCGLVLPHHQRRCPNCETEFDDTLAKCSECSEVIKMSSKECPKCGARFTHK
jgi:RNA polymerase subunit RPABC4/transcription elongation factor Spt4